MEIPGQNHIAKHIDDAVGSWRTGTGNVLFVTGEHGSGKSYVLDAIQRMLSGSVNDNSVVRVDCRPPIGSFNVAAIQPLQPFGYALEQLFLNTERTARKRLALNIGMSVLASIPIAGDIFYAVKAISQDVSEFKKETAAMQYKKRAAVDDCITTLQRVAKETPLILLVDDGHWSDSQSVEVVRRLLHDHGSEPLLLIWSINPTLANSSNLPLATLLRTSEASEQTLHLAPVKVDDVRSIIQLHAPLLKLTDKQVQLLQERSGGIPGILVEYIRYFERTNQIGANGSIDDKALSETGLKLSDHPATDVALHEVPELDALTLSLCAAEGREFTAFLVAALMNTDVLTAIRLLRRIQHETGCLKSLGMRTRYGVKTTTYEFTSSAAFLFFQHYPEYEERKHIHQRIVEILSRERDASTISEVKNQISAFIAAHNSEAENHAEMNSALESVALHAEEIGAFQMSEFIRNEFLVREEHEEHASVDGAEATTDVPSHSDHHLVHNMLGLACEHLISKEAQKARSVIINVLSKQTLTSHERLVACCIGARACIEMQLMKDAEAFINDAAAEPTTAIEDKVLLLNVRAVHALANNDLAKGREFLTEATRLTTGRTTPARLLTLANVVLMMREINDDNLGRFERAVRHMVHKLGWSSL